MSRLRPLEARRLVQLLQQHGFVFVSQRGSHAKLRNAANRTVIVPMHSGKPVKVGLVKRILAEAGIPEDELR